MSSASLAYRPVLYRSSLPEAARQQYVNSKRYEDDSYADKVNHYYNEFRAHHLQAINSTADVEATPEPKTKIYQLKPLTDDLYTTTTERYGYGILKKKPAEINANDSIFFKSCKFISQVKNKNRHLNYIIILRNPPTEQICNMRMLYK